MRKLLLGIGVLGIALMMTAPPVAAFHGAPYKAEGIATLAGKVFDAKLYWLGNQQGLLGGQYRMEIYEPITHVLLHKNTFYGSETFSNIRFVNQDGCQFLEIVDYLGVDTLMGGSIMTITGFQQNCLSTGTAYMEYHGDYLAFQIDLTVWTAL